MGFLPYASLSIPAPLSPTAVEKNKLGYKPGYPIRTGFNGKRTSSASDTSQHSKGDTVQTNHEHTTAGESFELLTFTLGREEYGIDILY